MRFYKSREYCRHIGCMIQCEIDLARKHGLSHGEKTAKRQCFSCAAWKFHQYLKNNKYSIVKIDK